MKNKWKWFIESNEHYCVHCPKERRELVILVADLKNFLRDEEARKKEAKYEKAKTLLAAGRSWSHVLTPDRAWHAMRSSWSLADWKVVADKFSPKVRVTEKLVREVHALLEEEKP